LPLALVARVDRSIQHAILESGSSCCASAAEGTCIWDALIGQWLCAYPTEMVVLVRVFGGWCGGPLPGPWHMQFLSKCSSSGRGSSQLSPRFGLLIMNFCAQYAFPAKGWADVALITVLSVVAL
jgi:hypothetical protein